MQDTEYIEMSALNAFRAAAPIDTGNLRFNSISLQKLGVINDNGELYEAFNVTVDDDIAPYAPYTNEVWLSPKWNGKRNPNQNWVIRGGENIAFAIAQITGGSVLDGDVFGTHKIGKSFKYNVKVRRNK